MNVKEHWENVYKTKDVKEVSWFQTTPELSLKIINELRLDKTCNVIDVGAGASQLAGCLVEDEYKNISVLDVSESALNISQKNLGANSNKIEWIVSNVLDFQTSRKYSVWHDRAVFHFIKDKNEIDKYVNLTSDCVSEYLIIASFAVDGPKKCSGLETEQYDEVKIKKIFNDHFELLNTYDEIHLTPAEKEQKFKYFVMKRRND